MACIAGIFCALLGEILVPRSIQVLMVRNDRDLPLSDVQVHVQSKVVGLRALSPSESDFVWVLLSTRESTFHISTRWADGTTEEFDSCYLSGIPVVYRVALGRRGEQPRCRSIAPAPLGLGILYAWLVTWMSKT